MTRRDRAADAALDLEAQREGQEQVRPADAADLGESQQRRRQRRSRVDDRRQMGVAIVEDVGPCRVQEGGGERVDTLGASDDRRLPAARELAQGPQCQFDRLGPASRDRHGKEVQQGALGFVARLLGKIVPISCRR
jgi:hypothetical protein